VRARIGVNQDSVLVTRMATGVDDSGELTRGPLGTNFLSIWCSLDLNRHGGDGLRMLRQRLGTKPTLQSVNARQTARGRAAS